ncbi:uncharacterized protein LTR77_008777 [Saxophila tyrrhenica]|uniref:Uncharacterized protein n=1 Tax=Saxophila tyrrhenica TaxID=1690608 RepID=A0AAV9P4A8_9PEZI|nr:hypothetical protein LTR77_008777 [Saxophila tyrrhenica]
MDDPDPKSNSKARFKSKWSRVLKSKDPSELETAPHHTNSFKLDDDVNDFLKPSTDRAASAASAKPAFPPAPKLDIAIAQRWPDANEVRRASAATPQGAGLDTPNGFRKPKRRKGLRVGFVRQEAEVIGEGGDECEEATMEVGKRRKKKGMGRSVSDARALEGARQAAGSRGREEQEFRPPPLRRAQTTETSEVSTPEGRAQVGVEGGRFGLSRTPTGFGSQDSQEGETSPEVERFEEFKIPKIDTRFAWEEGGSGSLTSASPKDPQALAVRKRELRSNEGMTLRRASAMITEGDDGRGEEAKRESLQFGVQPTQQHYDTLSRPDAPDLMPEPRSALSPQSARSPMGPSPFDDPKYVQRRSREVTPERAPQVAKPQGLRKPREAYQPSYMRAGQQQAPPSPPTQQQQYQAPPPPSTQQRPSIPAPPRVQPPPDAEYTHPPSYKRTSQQLNETSLPTRLPPAPSGSMQPPQAQYQSRSRDPSPRQDRSYGNTASSQAQRAIYSRPNGSNGSLNYQPPSPKHQPHSRSSSHDSQSSYQHPSSALSHPPGGFSEPSPTRYQTHSQSPQSGSPRSSMIGRSPLSPYGSVPSPGHAQQSYFGGTKAQHGQTMQPAALQPPSPGHLQVESPASRPVSASSNRSFSRPRPPQVQQAQHAPPAHTPYDETRQPSYSSQAQAQHRMVDPASPAQQPPPSTAPTRPSAQYMRQDSPSSRPSSSGSHASHHRPLASPQPQPDTNPAADAAYADFAARVAHMKGVFKLTSEKERPSSRCSPQAWLRAALWWYSRGKAGLEAMMAQQRPRSSDGQLREILVQAHVDLAKGWWILTDPLNCDEDSEMLNADPGARQGVVSLRSHLKALALSMGKNQLMPPPQSLIQGQDTTIWVEYPRFASGSAAVLTGSTNMQPQDALPVGESKDTHFYGRFFVDVSMSTDDAGTDRVNLPCLLTVMRGKREFLTTAVIASQSELVNIKIAPRKSGEKGLTWHDVSWKASACGMLVRLPHQYDLMVRMSERDFRSVWNIVEYARKVEHCFRPEDGEQLVLEKRLAEMQLADSANTGAFPAEKVKGAIAALFERTETNVQGGVERKLHRGYRLLLVTDPKHKALASTSHEIGGRYPLLFEFITDSAAGGMAAIVLRTREKHRQSRILLVFGSVEGRQEFYDVLNGLTVGPDELIVGKMELASMNIEPAGSQAPEGGAQQLPSALQSLQWQKLGVTNALPDEDDHSAHQSSTVASSSLRIIARHATGSITDRLNLSKGELLLRLPCTSSPTIQMLRAPQEDITMSLDTRHTPGPALEALSDIHHTVRTKPTIRSLTFPSFEELHAFQSAITGCTIRFDALAASLSIARRRMVVPIYKKWEASIIRLQVVTRQNVVQVIACMEGFSHAEALCFRVMSTDVFEACKMGKRFGLRLVDAKFALPPEEEKPKEKKGEKGDVVVVEESEEKREERVRRRFVNLEGLEYMSEHDDITVGFETVEERDGFAEALPTPATHSVRRSLILRSSSARLPDFGRRETAHWWGILRPTELNA